MKSIANPKPTATSKWSNITNMLLDISDAFTREPAELDFVLPGLLRGTAGVLVSPGGVGKSMFVLENAMSIASGSDLFGLWSEDSSTPIEEGKVVIVAVEDPVDVLQRRVHALGKDLSPRAKAAIERNLFILPGYGLGFTITESGLLGLQQSSAMSEFKGWLGKLPEAPRLVVFDTLNRCLGGANENTSSDMGKVMNAVEGICRDVGCSALIVHHTNKASATSGNGQAQFAVRGSSAITDNCRWQANMSVMSEGSAEKRGITDDEERRKWVRFDLSKVNYAAPIGNRWLYREAEGLLVGATPPSETSGGLGGAQKSKSAKQPKISFIDAAFGVA